MNGNGWIRAAAAIAIVMGGACQANAAVIAVGTRIPISATTFAVPIEISDAADVISWQFDLTYDATDVQVNTACDPFAGDVYCALFTGPVTEGDFFQSGAPFNLLNPGFINLDPITLTQTGLLFAVQGAFGGSAPFPSGAGVLAFVEFAVLGDGTSPITVTGSAVSAVPEPATLVLLTTGLLLGGGRRMMRYGRFSTRRLVVLAILALSMSVASAHAQTTAVGPYYAMPARDQTLPSNTRFVVLSNMNSEAVLDRETGLVWQRTPVLAFLAQAAAFRVCWEATTGGRQGWRIPTVAELMTLADPTNNRPFELRLAAGHPFVVTTLQRYWVSDRLDRIPVGPTFLDQVELAVYFGGTNDPNHAGDAGGKVIDASSVITAAAAVWCVRGGHGGSAR